MIQYSIALVTLAVLIVFFSIVGYCCYKDLKKKSNEHISK